MPNRRTYVSLWHIHGYKVKVGPQILMRVLVYGGYLPIVQEAKIIRFPLGFRMSGLTGERDILSFLADVVSWDRVVAF